MSQSINLKLNFLLLFKNRACNEVTPNAGRMITRSVARQVTNTTATIQSSISKSAKTPNKATQVCSNIDREQVNKNLNFKTLPLFLIIYNSYLNKIQAKLAELLRSEITIDSIVLIENFFKGKVKKRDVFNSSKKKVKLSIFL